MFGGHLTRGAAPLVLPPAVRHFYRAAEREATRLGDTRALVDSAGPVALAWLLHWARGRHSVAEIGTSAGWTALAFAVADRRRRVVSIDPGADPNLDRYAALVSAEARARVEFVTGRGEAGPPPGLTVDFLFIDEAHEHAGVVACFQAWRAALEPRAVVVFHDYHPTWPGVISAVQELGLSGRVRAGSFVWRPGG